MEVQPDFKYLLELFNAHNVKYMSVGDLPVKYIGLNEFIINKRTTGRKKDLSDLEALGKD